MRPICLTLVFAALLCSRASAQTCGAVAYDSDDGLAGNNYMGIFQDSRGILWVGSYAGGVSRFDGKRWENWTQAGGLFSNKVLSVFEDKEGGIWFDHNELGLSRWRDGKMQVFDFHTDTCAKGGLYFDRQQKKVLMVEGAIGGQQPTARIFEYDFSAKKFIDTGKRAVPESIAANYEGFSVGKGEKENDWWVYAWNGKTRIRDFYHIQNGQAQKLPAPSSFEENTQPFYSNTSLSPEAGVAIARNPKGVFILKNNHWQLLPAPAIPRYSPGGKTPPLIYKGCFHDAASNSLFVVWYLEEKTLEKRCLLAEYDATNLRPRRALLFNNPFLEVSAGQRQILKDAAGTIWMATYGNVLRLFPDQFYIPGGALGMPSQPWGVAQAGDGNIWFASYGDGLAGFDGLYLRPQPPGLKPKSGGTNGRYKDGSLTDAQGNVYFNSANPPYFGILKFDGKNRWEHLASSDGGQGFFLSRDKKERILWGTNNRGLWILPEGKSGKDTADWIKINRAKGLLLDNVLTCLEDRYGRYWMGRASQGIAMYDPKTDHVLNWLRQDSKNYGCMSMAEDARGNLWLGTDRGLCFFENLPDIGPDFDLQKKLLRVGVDVTGESPIMSCVAYDAHTLAIGNATGLHLFDLDAFYGSPHRVLLRSFNLRNGYQAGPVGQNAFFMDRDSFLWLTAANGAVRYDPRVLPRDTAVPQVFVDSIKAGNSMFKNFSERLSLRSEGQFLQVYFHASLNPMLYDNTRFEYRLTGDSTWVKVNPSAEFVTLQSLNPGSHRFEIRAVKGGLYSNPAVSLLNVPYWWQNPILWVTILLAAIGAGLVLQRIRLQRANQQIRFEKSKNEKDKLIAAQNLQIANQQLQLEKSKNDMAEMSKEKDKLQVQAIVNQLNPHFINNALQWLQVRVDEDEEAVRVVGKLSENISTVFKNSRMKKAFHSLRDEMKLTENYLFIQKCRFGERLTYEMPGEEILAQLESMSIPLMMVQIHVENAVEHGIRGKSTGIGRVSISLREVDSYAVITIEDDGVGRAAAKKIGSQGTQNGTTMLKELEAIYNKQNSLPLEQLYEDDIFTDEEGRPFGTRVIVRMPKAYNFDF